MSKAKKPMREVTFQNYEPLLNRLAFKFAQRLAGARIMGVGLDDVKGEMGVVFTLAARSYDPSKGYVFSTYLTTTAYNHFNHYAKKLIREQYGVESEPDAESRSTTTQGLGYCSVDVSTNEDGEQLSLYDMTGSDTYASPEDALHARQVVRDLIADESLSKFTRIYLMSVVNPQMALDNQVRQALAANARQIRDDIQARWDFNPRILRIGAMAAA